VTIPLLTDSYSNYLSDSTSVDLGLGQNIRTRGLEK